MARYQSILDRVSLLVTANVNALLDKALGANSVAVFDEYVNRMNQSLDQLENAEGIERGRVKTLTRQIGDTDEEVGSLDNQVDLLLAKGERTLAAARQAVLNTKGEILTDLKEELVQAQAEVGKLANSKAKLAAQIEVSKAQRDHLISLIEQKKSAQLRQQAQAGVHIAAPDQLRTGGIIERAKQELEQAEGQAEASSTSLDSRIDDLLGTDEVEVQLQAREAKLLGRRPKPAELPEPK